MVSEVANVDAKRPASKLVGILAVGAVAAYAGLTLYADLNPGVFLPANRATAATRLPIAHPFGTKAVPQPQAR